MQLPGRPDLDQYKNEAKELVKDHIAGIPEAIRLVEQHHPGAAEIVKFNLADAQLVIARAHGFSAWPEFAKHIRAMTADPAVIWKAGEHAIVTGDAAALEELLREHGQMLRERQPPEYGPGGPRPDYARGDARAILPHEHQFEKWEQFAEYRKQRADGISPVAKFEAAADAIVAGDIETLVRLLRENPALIRARSTRAHRATLLHYIGGNNGGTDAASVSSRTVMAGFAID